MKGSSPVSRDAPSSASVAPRSVDPLDIVTDLDTRADSEGLGLFKGTPDEGILRTNEQFLAVTGLSASTARGWDWLAAVHADDRDRLRRSIDAACTSGARSAFPVRMQVRLGVIESLRVVIGATPVAGASSVFVGLVQPLARPTGATRTIDAAATEPADRVDAPAPATDPSTPRGAPDRPDPYRVLVDAVPQPIAYAAPDGTVEFANPAWVARTGVDVDGALRAALGIDAADGAAPLRLALDAARPWSGRGPIGGRDTEIAVTPLASDLGGGFVVTLAEPALVEAPTAADAGPGPRPAPADAADLLAAQISLCERLVAAAPDYAAVLAPDGRVLSLNHAARHLLGLDEEADLTGLFAHDLARFADASECVVDTIAIPALLEHGYLLTEGTLAVGPEEGRPVGLLLFALREADGGLGAVLCIARDDTAMHEAQDRIAQSEQWYRALVQHSADIVAVVSEDLRATFVSPACHDVLGYEADELIGDSTWHLVEGADTERLAAAVERARSDGSATVEYEVHRRDDKVRTLETHIENLLDDPVIRGFVFIARDVTDARQASSELERRSEVDRFVAALSRSLVAATPATLDARVTESLDALATRFAARGGALFLRTVDEPRFCTEGSELSVADLELPAGGAFVAFDPAGAERAGWVLGGPDGPRGVLVLEWPPDSDVSVDELEPLEVIVAALVVAIERLDAEQAVRASEIRFRTLAEHATDLVVVVGPDLQLRYLSENAARFLGMSETDRFDPTDSVVHPEDRDGVLAIMEEVLAGGHESASREIVARFRRVDGAYRSVEIVVTNLLDVPDIAGVVLNAHDVTDRLEVEDALRESERRFRGLVQNLAESVTVLAADGSVKYSSDSAARMMGFDHGHGDGKFGLDFVVEEDRDRVAETVARAFSEPGIQGPITLRVRAAGDRIRVIEALGHNRLDDPDVEGIVVTARDITERVEAEEAARRSDSRLSALVQNLSDVITIVEPDGSIVYTSPTALRLFGFEEDDESRTDPTARIHPDDQERATREMAERLEQGDRGPVRFRLRAADGSWRSVETIMSDMTADPAVGGLVVTTRDVSDRTRAEALVADQAEILKLIARGAPLTETVTAICGVLERHVDAAAFGMLLIDAADERLRLVASPQVPAELVDCCGDLSVAEAEALFGGPLDEIGELLDLRANPMPVLLHAVTDTGVGGLRPTPILDTGTGRVIGVIVAFVVEPEPARAADDAVVEMFAQTAAIAIERRAAEDLLAHRANHDSLTGLPNRVLFLEFLSLALARTQRDENTLAVLFLDLDRFKHINDGLGHDAGDVLLAQLAARLRDAMRPSDVVARFGGDEFTVLCDGLDPTDAAGQVREVASRLLEIIEAPLSVDGEDRTLSASLGIAIGAPGSTADALLRDADAAMYEAKQNGKARFEIFDDEMRSSMSRRLDLETRLERAIEQDEFRLFIQPIVELSTGRCVGGEALLRWQDPELGLVSPDAFIGLAEETGLIIPVGEWALAEACRTVARWEQVGLLGADFTMSVNLSARQVAQADLAEKVRAVIERSRPTASRMCLEITETVLMEESSVEIMRALRDLGLTLSIDDFGTGYSSLGYLKRFPVDSVKVDRSFVDGLGTDGEDSAIVAAVVSLGHALGLTVVAEGVETSGQLRALMELGCDRAQGYWFSGPRSASEFAGLLNQQPWIASRGDWAV